jgi:membrane-anchored protein YejM (alkaline phosphatase superfamily)
VVSKGAGVAENNNHAEFKGSIMGQSFTITTKDVISLLLLIMIGLAGWFAWQSNEKRLDLFQSHHMRVFELFLESNKARDIQTHQIYEWLQTLAYNANRPQEEQLPLGLPLPTEPVPPH